MYRVLQGKGGKIADATFKAGTAMVRGMLVVKGADGEVNFPATATDKNVFFVKKEFIATGANGDRDLPDYSAEFENIAEGEGVVTEGIEATERYFTTEYAGNLTVGTQGYALVGTNGKLVASTSATRLKVVATDYNDCGHTGVVFDVLD